MKFLHKEVFIIAGPDDDSSTNILLAKDLAELRTVLAQLDAETDGDQVRVFHGFLCPANVLPPRLAGTTPYILWQNPKVPGNGFITDYNLTTVEGLARVIEEEILTPGSSVDNVDVCMEDLFIIYGYQVLIGLGVADGHINRDMVNKGSLVSFKVNHTNVGGE